MINKSIFCFTMFFVAFHFGYSQKVKAVDAGKKYDNYAFIDAIDTYERIAKKGYKDEEMFRKLGNAYYFNAELEKALHWYESLFEMNPEQEAEYYYRYSQCLKSVGDYTKSNKILEEFNKKSGNDQRAKLFKNNQDYLEVIKNNSGRYNIEDAGVNSNLSDYGSAFFGNKLVFASARDTGGVSKKVFKWTNQSFTNLYASQVDDQGKLGAPKKFSSSVNSKFNESTPVFARDGKTMYFTRNNFLDGKRKSDDSKVTLLKLYKAVFEDGVWQKIVELPFNSDQYSVAHPALSVDDKTLYFASNMPGTLGQSDLFKVSINDDGTYGTPENLGKGINTEGRETFPFVAGDGDLYFASDGRPGLGGLDIYVTKLDGKSTVQNVGEPVNSSSDDFCLLIDAQSRNGFFTSNRAGGKGYDDIYKFTEFKKIGCDQILKGVVTDSETGFILPEVKLGLYDSDFQLIKSGSTDFNGAYRFEVNCNKVYYVRAEKLDYETKEGRVEVPKVSGESVLALALDRRKKAFAVGTDLAKVLDIPMIYFDLGKSDIRPDAAFELEKVLTVMKDNPKMKVDIRSHTDCRQSAKNNLLLSDRRAKSTMAWLIKNGIESNRLTAKGYGESRLLNSCACEPTNASKCSEEEHQKNRRSEFIVVAVE